MGTEDWILKGTELILKKKKNEITKVIKYIYVKFALKIGSVFAR